ncbi:hypothetical protein RR46_09140 [Papilio xuthus]|uniref:Uncharacterized protein n=1 Tax=Papilio xuthus TaxID=66420 RepID=A0A194PW58_PAPXU|nr:hypothetical protein RR46_09140 [Papilio xuthus]
MRVYFKEYKAKVVSCVLLITNRTKGPECTPPCRRAQPTPRAPSAKRVGGLNPVPSDADGLWVCFNVVFSCEISLSAGMLEAVVLKYYRGGLSKLLRYMGQGF